MKSQYQYGYEQVVSFEIKRQINMKYLTDLFSFDFDEHLFDRWILVIIN